MPNFSLPALTTEAELHAFTQEVLRTWIRNVEAGSVPVRIPRPRGLLRLLPKMHFHLHAELFLQISGKTFFDFPEEKIPVGPGEICIVPRGMPHRERVRAWRGPFYNLVFTCYSGQITFHTAIEAPRDQPQSLLGTQVPATPCMAALLEEACELSQSRSEARDSGLRGLLIAYFSLILAEMQGWTAPSNPEPFKVIHARQLVAEQLSDPELSVAQLARQIQCSADYLSQVFRKATGMPLSAYINENRLLRSRELLELSTLNIAEVSQAAGFRDPSYFTRIFHRWQGMTPLGYRRTLS